MRILHVNDVASVGSLLVHASGGRDALYQPALRREVGDGPAGTARLALRRASDVFRLRRKFRGGAFTHMHVHYATFAYLADLAGVAYSLHVHGGDVLLDLTLPLKRQFVLRALRKARSVAVSTPDLVLPTRVLRPDAVYVPNPVQLPQNMRVWTDSHRPRIVVLSKMDRFKGWPEQVALLETLIRELPEMEVSFFAHGQLPDEERAHFTSRLLALGGRVTPPLSREAFVHHLADHQFALGQLEVGSLGMSELQAMALGIPTIANVAAHASAGHRPPVIQPNEAAASIRALWLEGSRGGARWGQMARDYLAMHHHPERSLQSLEAVLSQERQRS